MLGRISLVLLSLSQISALDPDTVEMCNQCKDVCEDLPQKVENPSFYEGLNVTYIVEGDFGSEGCKFLFHQKLENVTCCYIDIRRHHNNQGENLCGRLKEPKSCRKRETYEVTEIDGYGEIDGWCSMTLIDGQISDSGEYETIFPGDPKSNAKRIIDVKKYGLLYYWEIFLICLAIVVFIILMLYVWRNWLIKREKAQRDQDSTFVNLLQKKNDEFKEKLGKRSILGLRDRNHNNIFHLAAGTDWTEEMTKTVLDIATEGARPEEEKGDFIINKENIFRRLKVSSLSEWIPDNIPDYLIPKFILHLTINLNSRNNEGNTPLIIASKMETKMEKDQKNQLEAVGMLVRTNGVNKDITNEKKYTALHQAVLKKNTIIVELLLKEGASQETSLPEVDNSYTPLHTAVDGNSLEIVKLLVDYLERNQTEWAKQVKKGEKGIETPEGVQLAETPLYLALKSLEYKSDDIAKYLIENEYDIAHEDDKKFAVYNLVAAGKQSKLDLLFKNSNLKWEDYKDWCLQRAVESYHTQAVGNIYSVREGLKPDPTPALEKARSLLERMKTESTKNSDVKKMEDIIKRLTREADEEEEEDRSIEKPTQYEVEAISTKDEFFKYVSELKNKKTGHWWGERAKIIESLQLWDKQVNKLN